MNKPVGQWLTRCKFEKQVQL